MESSKIIANSDLFQLVDLNSVFLANSKESIWQLQPVNTGRNTEDGPTFIIPQAGFGFFNSVYLSPRLLNSFETGDMRKVNWVNLTAIGVDTFYYPFKYKSATLGAPITEYLMVLRLAEAISYSS